MKIMKMSLNEDGFKYIKLKTTLAELERITSEVREQVNSFEEESIACSCPAGDEGASIVFWIENPNYGK